MPLEFISIIIIISAVLIWLYIMHVTLIKKRNKVLEAFSCVDVQLKRRYDLLPNIIFIAKGYMEYEKNVLEKITKLRSQYQNTLNSFKNINKKLELNSKIISEIDGIFATFENYPQLKSDKTMILTMQTFSETEDHIAAARRFYNSAVNELKNSVEIFPSSLIASLMNIKAPEFFKAEEFEKASIKASQYLK